MGVRSRPVAARTAVVAMALAMGSLAGLSTATAGGGGGPNVFPGCAPTVQGCLDLAEVGETVIVEFDGFIDESVSFPAGKSLVAGEDYHPTLRGVQVFTNSGTTETTIAGLRLDRSLEVSLSTGTGHRVVIREVTIDQPSDVGDTGVALSTFVPASFVLERSSIHTESVGLDSLFIGINDPGGPVSVRVQSVRIDQRGATGDAGLRLQVAGAGTVDADIRSVSIQDVAIDGAGGGAGITLYFQDTIQADVDISGVTLVGVDRNAINLRNDVVGSGHLDLGVFNSIMAHNRGVPISLDPGANTFRVGYIDAWQNGEPEGDPLPLGPGSLEVNPRFVDRAGGDLRLRADSPLLDRGVVCAPSGVSPSDAAGRARLKGASVDMGAYERGAAAAPNHVELGDAGADTLTGTGRVDILCGRDGPDTLRGLAGGDWLDGGAGPDRLVGGAGPDRMPAGPGDDVLCAKDGAPGDRLLGGAGFDRGVADAGDTRLSVEGSGGCAS